MVKNIITLVAIMMSSLVFGQQILLSLEDSSLNYESSEDIYGFQFSHDGCVGTVSGGDAASAGFTVSSSTTTAIGFSFTGSYIPAGSGVLIDLGGNCLEDSLWEFVFSGTR